MATRTEKSEMDAEVPHVCLSHCYCVLFNLCLFCFVFVLVLVSFSLFCFVLLGFCFVSFCCVKSLHNSTEDVALFCLLSSGLVRSEGFRSVGEKKS